MLDDVQEPVQPEKSTLTQRPKVEPTPVYTVMNDGTLRLAADVGYLELKKLHAQSGLMIDAQHFQQATLAMRTLAVVAQRYDGFDEDTARMLKAALGQPTA